MSVATGDRPLVVVTAKVRPLEERAAARVELETGYLEGVLAAGMQPVVVSPAQGLDAVRELLAAAHGLLLTGGEDVDPGRYGEAPAGSRNVSVERDEIEFAAAEIALERKLPTLAICRGMQLLNVVRGGRLYQDLRSQTGTEVRHDRAGAHADRAVHDVRVEGPRLLEGVFRETSFGINSSHHQAVRDLGDGLTPVAWASDGVIEAVELRNHGRLPWTAGVQWHPERMLGERSGANRRLFLRFGHEVQRRAGEGG